MFFEVTKTLSLVCHSGTIEHVICPNCSIVTPTKSRGTVGSQLPTIDSEPYLPSTPPMAATSVISSPAEAGSGNSPTDMRKRRMEDATTVDNAKRQRIVAGFVEEDDDDYVDRMIALEESETQSRGRTNVESKSGRTIGGFVDEDDEDEIEALHDAYGDVLNELPKRNSGKPPESKPADTTVRGPFVEGDEEVDLYGPSTPKEPQSQGEIPVPSQIPDRPGSPTSRPVFNATLGGESLAAADFSTRRRDAIPIKTCSGRVYQVSAREKPASISYEKLVATRSTVTAGKAQRSYYGIDIHRLLDEAATEAKEDTKRKEQALSKTSPSHEPPSGNRMWTEKYRARKFADLIGDERTHRSVLRWLKSWDPIVFPGLAKKERSKAQSEEDRSHRKLLLLTGPPGLGKTTLAHVCARQAGYEVLEINASDERSKNVVNGRIKDAVGTENVKCVSIDVDGKKETKPARPVCVVIDEVDGVVSGSGSGGEGGFIKALIDLVMLDQKNSASGKNSTSGRKKKSDNFRLLRPMILICNDVYHPSLRPLRTARVAEIIHVRQVPLENIVKRMTTVLDRERIPYDVDGVRRLCEASWGMPSRKDRNVMSRGAGEGDIRSILVSAEWVAHKIRATKTARLTKAWLEENVLNDYNTDSASKGLGRGGVREIVERVFTDGGGFPNARIGEESFWDPFDPEASKTPIGVAELRKRHAVAKLREMVDSSGEYDRCVTECFANYPTYPYQDDTYLSKPNAAYDWLHFHDMLSSRVFSNQEWELNPYLSQAVIAFHHLFASANTDRASRRNEFEDEDEAEEEHPFSGPRADFAAFEAQKQNRAILSGFQSSFPAPMLRLFRSLDTVVTELVPSIVRMLSPDIKPVVVRGSEQMAVASVRKESERALVRAAVRVMTGLGVTFEKARVEDERGGHNGFIYRMEP